MISTTQPTLGDYTTTAVLDSLVEARAISPRTLHVVSAAAREHLLQRGDLALSQAFSREVNALVEKKAIMEDERDRQLGTVNELAAANQRAAEAMARAAALTEECQALRVQLDGANSRANERDAQRSELSHLRERLRASQGLAEECQALTEECQVLRVQLEVGFEFSVHHQCYKVNLVCRLRR